MKFSEINAYRARAAHCSHQSDLTTDPTCKKYWHDLADDWLALAKILVEKDRYGNAIP